MPTQLFGTGFSKDEYGVSSWVVPFHCADAEEADSGSLPSPVGLPENVGKRNGREWDGGGYVVYATFEGMTPGFNEDKNFWEFDSSFKNIDIRAHPKIQELITKYGGQIQDDGTITWPLIISAKSSGAFGASKSSSTRNPMYGADTALELNAVYRSTKIRKNVSSDLLDRIGTIKKGLPDGLPTPPNRDWLIFPPRAYERGNVVQEVDEWLLGPVGGWPEVQELMVI
jgi:hypothetical protein